jgi:hypothetical protein
MKPILYLGDTSLASAAAYLAGLMTCWKWPFRYVPSERPLSADELVSDYSLFVFSDYPAARIDSQLQARIIDQVEAGAGLLMIGGWESFHGSGGGWSHSQIAEALPVAIDSGDDRVNGDQPLVVRKAIDHQIVAGLPFDERPPIVGGYNRFKPKPNSTLVLELQPFLIRRESNAFSFSHESEPAPLLVVGQRGAGRTAAFASDVAPHWVGPLVDWGPQRVVAQAPGAEAIEVGSDYARFFHQLLAWTARLVDAAR